MDELIYQLALTLVPNIGDHHARILVQELGSASSVFRTSPQVLEKIEGIGEVRARSIRKFTDFHLAESEARFVERAGIRPLFLTDSAYPQRLLNCYDAPLLLFYKGSAELNAAKVLAIVGTRSHTDYGRQVTEKLVRDLAEEEVLILSGLAFGIDALAHKAALKHGLPTVGVVGHGLDKVYPWEHRALAGEMIDKGGGLLTEFFSGIKPDKHHFPLRNRIVAGMSDATVVIETNVKGGSMITAKLADGYNRDVFAVPGRISDKTSAGCHHLIQHNKAILFSDAASLMEVLGWKERPKKKQVQKELFIELSAEQSQIVQLLQEKETVALDELNLRSGLSSSQVASALLHLELQHVVASLPGKMYRLL